MLLTILAYGIIGIFAVVTFGAALWYFCYLIWVTTPPLKREIIIKRIERKKTPD